MDFLSHPDNLVFSILLTITLLLSLAELVLTVIGGGFGQVLEGVLPDLSVPQAADLNGFSQLLSVLKIDRLPAFFTLILFLVGTGVSGLMIQLVISAWLSAPLYWPLALLLSLLPSLLMLRLAAAFLSQWITNDYSESQSRDTFAGQIATITLGEAKVNHPAEAKFTDDFGTTHYVMVQPANQHESFLQGQTVLITGPVVDSAAVFEVVAFERPLL